MRKYFAVLTALPLLTACKGNPEPQPTNLPPTPTVSGLSTPEPTPDIMEIIDGDMSFAFTIKRGQEGEPGISIILPEEIKQEIYEKYGRLTDLEITNLILQALAEEAKNRSSGIVPSFNTSKELEQFFANSYGHYGYAIINGEIKPLTATGNEANIPGHTVEFFTFAPYTTENGRSFQIGVDNFIPEQKMVEIIMDILKKSGKYFELPPRIRLVIGQPYIISGEFYHPALSEDGNIVSRNIPEIPVIKAAESYFPEQSNRLDTSDESTYIVPESVFTELEEASGRSTYRIAKSLEANEIGNLIVDYYIRKYGVTDGLTRAMVDLIRFVNDSDNLDLQQKQQYEKFLSNILNMIDTEVMLTNEKTVKEFKELFSTILQGVIDGIPIEWTDDASSQNLHTIYELAFIRRLLQTYTRIAIKYGMLVKNSELYQIITQPSPLAQDTPVKPFPETVMDPLEILKQYGVYVGEPYKYLQELSNSIRQLEQKSNG